jgi:hypothetical protein
MVLFWVDGECRELLLKRAGTIFYFVTGRLRMFLEKYLFSILEIEKMFKSDQEFESLGFGVLAIFLRLPK